MDDIAYLISQKIEYDEIGQEVLKDEIQTPIYISVNSITRAEFFSAGRQGLTPDFMFTTAAINYHGEKIIDFTGKRFFIYRTYLSNNADTIELYVKREAGVQNEC